MDYKSYLKSFLINKQYSRKNFRFIRKVLITILALIAAYSFIFYELMLLEERQYSAVSSVYWTLTVMTTLGFGDITFNSDLGRIFTMVVLLSGVVFFVMIMPFVFIHFFYVPWLEIQNKARIPRELPRSEKGHTLIIGYGPTAMSIADKLHSRHLHYCLMVDDADTALSLHEEGYRVLKGDLDMPKSYLAARADQARFIIALHDEYVNANIAATVREVAPDVPVVSTADNENAHNILLLAGCRKVYNFAQMLGQSMAHRVYNAAIKSHIIGRFEELCLAEAQVPPSGQTGLTICESAFRERLGLNVAGIWQGEHFVPVTADTVLQEKDVFILAGKAEDIEKYDRETAPVANPEPVLVVVLGGGRVGKAATEVLGERGMDYRIVDHQKDVKLTDEPGFVLGDAADPDILKQAGIETATAVLITTHNDNLNIYLTVFCRELRPDVQIICRAALERNVGSLYNAGASVVLSQSAFTNNTIINLLHPEYAVMLAEGVNVFHLKAPPKLVGKNLIQSGIRPNSGCNVAALYRDGKMIIPPDPETILRADDEIVLIGSEGEEEVFRRRYTNQSV